MDGTTDHSAGALTGTQKAILFVSAIACYGAWYALGHVVSLPAVSYFSGLLIDRQPVVALASVAIAIPLMSAIIWVFTSKIHLEAGLFCCAVGLACLPARGGDIRSVLLSASSPAIYLSMIMELAFLTVVIAAGYQLLVTLSAYRLASPEKTSDDDDPDTARDRLLAIVSQTLCTLLLMTFLCQSPVIGQAIVSICAAGLLASLATHQTFGVRGAIWYILGTMLAGVVAYGFAYANPAGMAIGDIRSTFAGAARALPLHYASLGVAGAIYGYWTSVNMVAVRKIADADPAKA